MTLAGAKKKLEKDAKKVGKNLEKGLKSTKTETGIGAGFTMMYAAKIKKDVTKKATKLKKEASKKVVEVKKTAKKESAKMKKKASGRKR